MVKQWTTSQMAGLLGVSTQRVRALAREGRLPAARAGRRWVFPRTLRAYNVIRDVAVTVELEHRLVDHLDVIRDGVGAGFRPDPR
jgi:excisionase family DNA binding protein